MSRAEHERFRQAIVGQASLLWRQCSDIALTRLVSWPPGCDKVIDSLVQIQISNVGLELSHFSVSSVQEIIDHNPVVPPAKSVGH